MQKYVGAFYEFEEIRFISIKQQGVETPNGTTTAHLWLFHRQP